MRFNNHKNQTLWKEKLMARAAPRPRLIQNLEKIACEKFHYLEDFWRFVSRGVSCPQDFKVFGFRIFSEVESSGDHFFKMPLFRLILVAAMVLFAPLVLDAAQDAAIHTATPGAEPVHGAA